MTPVRDVDPGFFTLRTFHQNNDGTLERVISPASGHFGVSPLKNEGLLNVKSGDSELGNKILYLLLGFM